MDYNKFQFFTRVNILKYIFASGAIKSYSIASSPCGNYSLELHVQHGANDEGTDKIKINYFHCYFNLKKIYNYGAS
jgi:hypothetical protein